MPELPDVEVYVERLEAKLAGQRLLGTRLASPFLVRTYDPPLSALSARRFLRAHRIGKRIVMGFEQDLFAVVHLMIAGRFRSREKGATLPGKHSLCGFDFEQATLWLTEAGSKKRASLHLVRGTAALAEFDRGGIDPLSATLAQFDAALRRENRTLKRALTDPRILNGIGNAYSDEILFSARLSPVKRTSQIDAAEMKRLYRACGKTLSAWLERTRRAVGDGFPEQVTAFREGMAVHGRYREPCRSCGTPVQRVRYADSELNYCPTCQTGGRLLADRGLSRLLGGDWPKTLAELEERLGRA